MNSFIEKATLSVLTVSCLSLALPSQSQAFTSQLKSATPITNQTIYRPQPEVDFSQSQASKGELFALDIGKIGKSIGNSIGRSIQRKLLFPSNQPNNEEG